jgi:hypothetical protein
VYHLHRHFNADQNAARKSIELTRQSAKERGAQGFFFGGKMGNLGGVLFVGGIEHTPFGFPGIVVDLVECGKIPLVRWRKNGVVAALAGARGVSRRFGIDALGGAIKSTHLELKCHWERFSAYGRRQNKPC